MNKIQLNNKIKIILLVLVITIPTKKINAQKNSNKNYSYGIWIEEFKKGWVDSENSFWLIECSNKFENIKSKKIEISYLARPLDFVAENCCKDENYKTNNKNLIYTGSIWNVRQFFDTKETFKIKVNSKTIRIIALKQSNCKCSPVYIDNQNASLEKVAVIFNYQFLELSREEKKNFKSNKRNLIKYFEKL